MKAEDFDKKFEAGQEDIVDDPDLPSSPGPEWGRKITIATLQRPVGLRVFAGKCKGHANWVGGAHIHYQSYLYTDRSCQEVWSNFCKDGKRGVGSGTHIRFQH